MGIFDFLDPAKADSDAPADMPQPGSNRSTFERTFDPDKSGTLFGLIGRLNGVPTAAERKASEDAETMGTLSSMLEQSGSPQKAILQFLQTPNGKRLMSQPGGIGTLEAWTKTITPPNPVGTPTAPGSTTTFHQNGKNVGSVSQPPAEAQNWNAGVPQIANTGPGTTSTAFNKNGLGQSVTVPTNRVQENEAKVPEIAVPGPGGKVVPVIQGQAQPAMGASNPPTETQNMTNGVPQPVHTPAGGRTDILQNGQLNPRNTIQVLPEHVQTFNGLTSRMSKLTPELLDTLVVNQLNQHDTQQQALALQKLVAAGAITPEQANEFAAKTVQLIPETNDVGERTGRYIMFDQVRRQTRIFNAGAGQDPSGAPNQTLPTQMPGMPSHSIPPNAYNTDGSIDPLKLSGRKYMGLGVGPGPVALSLAGTALRWADTANNEQESQLASIRQNQLAQLETVVTMVGSAQNGRLKVQTDTWQDKIPSKWSTPIEAYNKLIQLHDMVQNLRASENVTYQNRALPKEARVRSQEAVSLLDNVLAFMPSRQESLQMLTDLKAGKAGAISPAGAIKAMGNMAGDAVESGKRTLNEVKGQPAQQPTQPLPKAEQIMKMNEADIRALATQLPPGPSPERTQFENRLRELQAPVQPKPGKRSEKKGNIKLAGDVVPLPMANQRQGQIGQLLNGLNPDATRYNSGAASAPNVLPMGNNQEYLNRLRQRQKQGSNPFEAVNA